MQPSQLGALPPEQAVLLVRKKRFWKKTMRFSLGIGMLLLIGSLCLTLKYVLDGRGNIPPPLDAEVFIHTAYTLLRNLDNFWNGSLKFIISGSFLLFLLSLIRCLSLPKLPNN